jgi:lysozyme family protein
LETEKASNENFIIMANYKNIIPFIQKWEGGKSSDTRDKAASSSVNGVHTNKGITWATFQQVFGSSEDAKRRFLAMAQTDWEKIFKGLFWDTIKGDEINSQRIADVLVNWAWGSGTATPVKALQTILKVKADGVVGPATIKALNASNEADTFKKLQAANRRFFAKLGAKPEYAWASKGWENRLDDLYNKYVPQIVKDNPASSGALFVTLLILITLLIVKNAN